MRNAISPAFAAVTPCAAWFKAGQAPVLVYTSAPYRGLNVLLDAVPIIRSAISDMRLRVFSGSRTQATTERRSLCGALPALRVDRRASTISGTVPQAELAAELSRAAALAYPSTFPETSCIAAMEAMSAGANILTTRSGAMPETTAGYGLMIEPHDDEPRLAKEFAQMTIDALAEARREPELAEARRNQEIQFARENYSWPARALEWEAYLSDIVRQSF